MKLVSVPRPLVFHVLRVAIPFFLLVCFYISLSVSKHHSFLFSTYEFMVVAKSNSEFVFFMVTVVSLTINIVFGILRPPREDADHYVRLDQVKDNTVLRVSDEDCDEDNNECGSDGYDEDNDDDGSEESERRAEEFIAKHARKWREDFVYEKLTYMASIELQSALSSPR